MMLDISSFIALKWAWSLRTFGTGRRTLGLTAHIRRELAEIEQNPDDPEEWVDVVLLALDGLSRLGLSGKEIETLILAKQIKNMLRKWPAQTDSQNEPIEHVR